MLCLSDISSAVFMADVPLCTSKYLFRPKNADVMETWLISVLLEKFMRRELAFGEQ